MDRINLPWVPPRTSVSEAIAQLIAFRLGSDAGAVVSERGGRPVILPLDRLVAAARANENASVEDVEPLAAGMSLPLAGLAGLAGGMEADLEAFAPALDAAAVGFAAIRLPGSLVHVITRHETIAAQFRSDSRVCRCTGPRGHVLFAADLSPDLLCIYDSQPVICA